MTTGLAQQLDGYNEDELYELLADLRLQLDFEQYAKQVLKVQKRVGGGVVPFVLNRPQKVLLWIFDDIKAQGRLIRAWILKGRRMGISTLISGLFYQKVSNTKSYYAIQVTHEPDASDFLFEMVKRYYNHSPEQGRPETLFNNKKLLAFNNAKGTGLDSAFRIATAGKENIGSGQNVNRAHLSEVAFYGNNADSILKTLSPCIPQSDPDSMLIGESTANGMGGLFHMRFWGARCRYWISKLDENGQPVMEQSVNPDADLDNEETSVFFPWFVFEDNQKEPPPEFALTDDEVKIRNEYNLSLAQMYWRRFTIANDFSSDVALFNEAHPATPEEAFISTGKPYFDNPKLLAEKKVAPPPRARYEYNVATGAWEADPHGRLFVWEEPKPGQSYVIGADVSEGLVEGDFNSADVVNHRTGDHVAQWHGKCFLTEWGDILVAMGKRYKDAILAVEVNNAGIAVVNRVAELRYPRQYMREVIEPPMKPVRKFGWQTNEKTRPMILDSLKQEVSHGTHGIKCAETMGEMLVFQRTKTGRYEAQSGCFDDRVMSIAIAKHIRDVEPIPMPPPPKHHKQDRKNPVGKRGGWGGV